MARPRWGLAANGVFQAVNDQPLLVVVLSLIAGLAALWAAWAEFEARELPFESVVSCRRLFRVSPGR